MSTDQFNRKIDEGKKLILSIKKDFRTREEQQKNRVPNYALDAEIKGSFGQLDEKVKVVEKMFENFQNNQKSFGFTNKQMQKRQQQCQQLANQRTNLKRQFDSFFSKKTVQDLLGENPNPGYKPEYNEMNSKQLVDEKKKLDEQEDKHLDELIGIVKNTKQGNKAIKQELIEQDKIIDEIDRAFDENIENMGRVRRNMAKLVYNSSNMCLVISILIQIAGIICILVLWK